MFRDREQIVLERSTLSYMTIDEDENIPVNVCLSDSRVSLPAPGHVSYPWEESHNAISPSSTGNLARLSTRETRGMVDATSEPSRVRKLWSTSFSRPENYRKESDPYDKSEKEKTPYCDNRDEAGIKRETSRMMSPCDSSKNQYYEEVTHTNLIAQEEFQSAGNPVQRLEPSDKNQLFDDQVQENIAESPVTGRIPSPSSASSIASGRRLEWDSGADVGYNLIEDHVHSEALLSTIERIALARGCSAALFERLDPEGTSGPPKPVLGIQYSCQSLDSPIAKSTPIYRSENKVNSRSLCENPITPIIEPCETVLPGGYLFLHSSEEFDNDVAPSPQNGSSEQEKVNSDDDKLCSTDNLHKKLSNSLINLSSCHEEIQTSVPRSQSYLNLLNKENNEVQLEERGLHVIPPSCTLAATCSVSSSSVATIVQKSIFPKTSDKLVQTLPLKLSVGVQAFEDVESSHSLQKVDVSSPSTTLHVMATTEKSKSKKVIVPSSETKSQNHRCSGAHKKGTFVSRPCHSYQIQKSNVDNQSVVKENENDEKESNENEQTKEVLAAEKEQSTLGSAASSSQTVGSSCNAETSCSGAGVLTEGYRAGVVDSANSFEYLPGHVFENVYKRQSELSKQSIGSDTSKQTVGSDTSKQSLASETSRKSDISDDKSLSKSTISPQNIKRSDSHSSSLSKDIEEGVEQLQKLMSEKSYNSKTKKKLIRQVINKLVNTEYSEDCVNKDQFQGIPLSSNVPWVPAAASVQYLKTANAYKYIGAGDWSNKILKNVQNSSKHSCSDETNDKSVESAISEEQSSPSIYTPSGSLSVPGDNEQSQAESSVASSNIISVSVQKDWKMPTSRAEKNFERQMSSDKSASTTSLLHLCKSEHEKQLQWIRFEIDHLSHLKQLLEKQEKVPKSILNLAHHEHKFHQINSADKKSSCNKFQRSMEKRSNNSNKGTEQSIIKETESSQYHVHLKNQSSSGLIFLQPELSSEEQFLQTSEEQVPALHKQEKVMKKRERKHNLSTQTSTPDSYVLYNDDNKISGTGFINSSNCSSNYDEGRLNVFVQRSPKGVKKYEKVHESIPLVVQASENARKSYRSAMRCCCDCRRSLQEILLPEHVKKKDEHAKTYCKCRLACAGDAPEVDYSSFDQCASSVSFPVRQYSISESSNSEALNVPQKRNIATETTVNKSVQTSSSLSEIPLIKPVWNQDNVGKEERASSGCQKEGKFCPCCGLLEIPFDYCEKRPSSEKPKKQRTDVTCPFQDKENKKKICNASVQTSGKEPLAYLLTFEPTCEENVKTQSNDSLPEIKLLVPVGQNKLENEVRKKSQNMGISKENQCPPDNPLDTEKVFAAVNQPLQEGEKKKQKLTLQEYLRANRPDYIQHADKRSQCLADLALLRELRKQKRLELMSMTDKSQNAESNGVPSNENIILMCTEVPSKPKLSAHVMREQSRRKYYRSREVQNKLVERKKKEDFRTNRLMAELFTKKLQKKVLEGVVNHSNSASVISSVL